MSKQATISHVFAKAKNPVVETAPIKSKTEFHGSKKLESPDPRVQAFYDQLSPPEIVAHSIAVTKLGTSYDVTRTHGFLRWSKSRPT